jgi:hypothetical protein
MKLTLALAALLLAASVAGADQINTAQGPVYIPNGSSITIEQSIPDPWGESAGPGLPSGLPATLLDFIFADGYGQIITAGIYGELGSINFITPVAGLSLGYDSDGTDFWVMDNLEDLYGYPDSSGGIGTANWSGPGILAVNFGSGDGSAGIDSMTYSLDGPHSVPEPPTVAMLLLGLAVIGVAFLLYLFVRIIVEYRHDTRIAKDREEHGW